MTELEIKEKCTSISDFMQELFDGIPEHMVAELATFAATESAFYGSQNEYEGLGILEKAKGDLLDWYSNCENEPCEGCKAKCEGAEPKKIDVNIN